MTYLLLWVKVLVTDYPTVAILVAVGLLTAYIRAACQGRKE